MRILILYICKQGFFGLIMGWGERIELPCSLFYRTVQISSVLSSPVVWIDHIRQKGQATFRSSLEFVGDADQNVSEVHEPISVYSIKKNVPSHSFVFETAL